MKRSLLVLAVLGFIGGCASVGSGAGSPLLLQLDDASTGTLQALPAVLESKGQPAVLYANKAGRVVFLQGGKPQLLDETARVKEGNHFQLNAQGKDLHASWWSHQDGKNVYFTSSADGGKNFNPVSMVNDANGILPPYTVTRGADGVVGMTYQDERQPNYQVYFNRSTDHGQTWARPDQRLDTPPANGRDSNVHEPQTVEAGKVWVSAWTDTAYAESGTIYRIMSRRSEDAGLSWTPSEVLYSSDRQISSLKVRSQGAQVVLAADNLSRGIFALASQDAGRSWQKLGVLSGTDQASNSGVDVALANGRAHVVWMQDRKEEKTRIMRASLDVAQSKWLGAVQRVDVKVYENTRSVSPSVVATAQGALLATWVDYRDIRSNIYLSASYDQGQTWSAPQALLKPGEVAAGWPRLMPWGEQAAIAYETYPTDRILEGKFLLRQLSVGDAATGLPGMAKVRQFTEAERKAKLESRLQTLWKARVAGDYDTAYDIFDFAFKASTPKKFYMSNVGVITYLGFTVEDVVVTGNEASVKMKVKYEVQSTMMPSTGKPIVVTPVEVDSPSTWVWVGNDWYLVYAPSFDPPMLKY